MQVQLTVTVNSEKLRQGFARLRSGLSGGSVAAVDTMFSRWAKRYEAFTRDRFNNFSRGSGDWPPLAPSTILRRRLGNAGAPLAIQARLAASGGNTLERAQHTIIYRKAKAAFRKEHRGMDAGRLSYLSRDAGFRAVKKAGGRVRTRKQIAESIGATPGAVSIMRDTGTIFNALTIGAAGNVSRHSGASAEYGIGGAEQHPTPPGRKGHPASIAQIAAYHQMGGAIPGRPPQRKILDSPDEETVKGMERDGAAMVRALFAGDSGGQT